MRFRFSASLLSIATLVAITSAAQANEYFPTIDSLAGNPRAMCKTLLATNSHSNILSTDTSISSSSAFHHEMSSKYDNMTQTTTGGGGKVSFLGISAGGNGKKETTERNSGSNSSTIDQRFSDEQKNLYSHDLSYTETIAFEQADCDGYLDAAAAVQSAQINAEVQHHAIEAKQQKSNFDILMQEEW